MLITKKHQYALRAIFELAKHYEQGPLKISKIADAQAIPERFLEVILAELKKGGFVRSKRGFNGGYELVPHPDRFRVGDLMRFLTRDLNPVECMAPIPEANCPFQGQCAFFPMWKEVKEAIFNIYDNTTFQDLLDCEQGEGGYPLNHPSMS
jgi:Rrf2 family protein